MNKVEFNVAGITFRKENIEEVCGKHNPLKPFDAFLEREPDNQYDANAIKVIVDNTFIGYVPAKLAVALAPVLDSGGNIGVEVTEIGNFEKHKKNGEVKVLPYCKANILMD